MPLFQFSFRICQINIIISNHSIITNLFLFQYPGKTSPASNIIKVSTMADLELFLVIQDNLHNVPAFMLLLLLFTPYCSLLEF